MPIIKDTREIGESRRIAQFFLKEVKDKDIYKRFNFYMSCSES